MKSFYFRNICSLLLNSVHRPTENSLFEYVERKPFVWEKCKLWCDCASRRGTNWKFIQICISVFFLSRTEIPSELLPSLWNVSRNLYNNTQFYRYNSTKNIIRMEKLKKIRDERKRFNIQVRFLSKLPHFYSRGAFWLRAASYLGFIV